VKNVAAKPVTFLYETNHGCTVVSRDAGERQWHCLSCPFIKEAKGAEVPLIIVS